MVTIELNVNELRMNRMIKSMTFRKARKWQTDLAFDTNCTMFCKFDRTCFYAL